LSLYWKVIIIIIIIIIRQIANFRYFEKNKLQFSRFLSPTNALFY